MIKIKKLNEKKYDLLKHNARVEASLYNIEKVKYIAWDPDVTTTGKAKRNPNNSLKGKYLCRYED